MKDYEKYLDIIFDITFDLAVRHDILLYNLPCDYFSANHRAENLPGQPIYICIPCLTFTHCSPRVGHESPVLINVMTLSQQYM